MRRRFVVTALLSLALVGYKQAPMPADGMTPVFSDRVPADSESLACMTESLVVAGFTIDDGHTDTDITWRRAGSPGFGGELSTTYIVRAKVDGADLEWLLVDVATARSPSLPTAAGPAVGGAPRPGMGQPRNATRPPSDRGQERVVLRSEIEPIVQRCAGRALERTAASDTVDVLFLGNSYTYYNNLPRLLEGISESLDGPVIRAAQHTHGGFSLRRHLTDGHVPQVFDEYATDGDVWEQVVLQEQSRLGAPYADSATGTLGDPRSFHEATRALVELVRERSADPLLYMTWAKERFPAQTDDLARAYDDIGKELRVPVAPIGLAWARVVQERPALDLFIADGSHPTPAGSYLAACVLYAQLTGQSPEGATLSVEGLPWETPGRIASDDLTWLVNLEADVGAYLQEVAWATVRGRVQP